jgi:hypothetical protein
MDIMTRTARASVNDVKEGMIDFGHGISYECKLRRGTVRKFGTEVAGAMY